MNIEEQYCPFCELEPVMACDAYTFYLEHYRYWIEGWLIELFDSGMLTDCGAQYFNDMDNIFLDNLYEEMEESWEIYGN